MNTLIFASKNAGKIKEIKQILAPFQIEVKTALDFNLPDVEETGKTFVQNALLKAETIAEIMKMPVLADDSGLCVDALGGAPGVFSARYAPTSEEANKKLIQELKALQTNNLSAHFECVMALVVPGKDSFVFDGRVDGKIVFEPRGTGFGYDPIFVPEGYNETFGQMLPEQKNKISHRGRAMQKFIGFLNETKTF